MTREETIRMAREAGAFIELSTTPEKDMYFLERFASLVEAAVEDRLKWDGLHSCHPECDRPACVHTRKAVEAEREACAKVCEELEVPAVIYGAHPDYVDGKLMAKEQCADAIRARGQQ